MCGLHVQKSVRILREAFTRFPRNRISLSFSGAEDIALVHLASKVVASKAVVSDQLPVFTLDTGRLHPETVEYLEKVRMLYNLDLDVLAPDAQEVRELVRSKGLFSFRRDGHEECCYIRKVKPLQRKLSSLSAWITGQRRDQNVSRATLSSIETGPMVTKYNPMAEWSSQEVWAFIHGNRLPTNPLHAQGYHSIGCAPCSRAILPGQHEREGRWWWTVGSEKKECGLHKNVTQ